MATANFGVYVTHDGAASWTHVGPGITDPSVDSFAIDPTDTGTLYAGTLSKGVFKSTDAGSSWVPVNAGLPIGELGGNYVLGLAVDPHEDTIVYAGLAGLAGSVYRSTNGGTRWSPSWSGMSGRCVTAVAIDPQDPSTVFAGDEGLEGIFRSTDGGRSWGLANHGLSSVLPPPIDDLLVDGTGPMTVYATAGLGTSAVFKSSNGGRDWATSGTGFLGGLGLSLVMDPTDHLTLYGSSSVGISKTTDGGATWTPVFDRGLWVQDLALDPNDPSIVYAAVRSVFRTPGGIWRSTDAGATWEHVLSLPPDNSSWTVGVDPSTSAVFAGAGPDTNLFSGHMLLKSVDQGATWHRAMTGLPDAVASTIVFDPAVAGGAYVAMAGAGVFRTTDGGGTWAPMNDGLFDVNVDSFAIDADGSTLYGGVCAGGGVFAVSPR